MHRSRRHFEIQEVGNTKQQRKGHIMRKNWKKWMALLTAGTLLVSTPVVFMADDGDGAEVVQSAQIEEAAAEPEAPAADAEADETGSPETEPAAAEAEETKPVLEGENNVTVDLYLSDSYGDNREALEAGTEYDVKGYSQMYLLAEAAVEGGDASLLEITFDTENGLDISVVDQPVTQPTLFDDDSPRTRQKRYILKVTFPDGRVSCHRIVWKTMNDVIRYAGPERVQQLGIMVAGLNLVSSELHELERYRAAQKEVAPGLYVYGHTNTNTKYEQILTISRQLDLGLKVEKVSIIGDED